MWTQTKGKLLGLGVAVVVAAVIVSQNRRRRLAVTMQKLTRAALKLDVPRHFASAKIDSPTKPLKILCLHGGGGTAAQMKDQMQHVKDHLGPLVDFVFVSAPPEPRLTPTKKPGSPWFAANCSSAAGWDARWAEVLGFLEGVLASQGPFDGLVGYSNGGACASSLLCATPKGMFRFVLVLDGHMPMGKTAECRSTVALLEQRQPIETPTLFTVGAKSYFKPSCEELSTYFAAPEMVHHPAGHVVPRDETSLERIADFLRKQVINGGH